MSDTYKPLMKGVIAELKGDAGIAAVVSSRVYSNTPQNATFPYLTVAISSSPFSAIDFSGMEHEISIAAFSRKSDPEEAANLRSLVFNALDRQESNLSLDSGNIASLQYTGVGFVEREPDGVTWQALARFRCVIT